jgi:hypothetical protein
MERCSYSILRRHEIFGTASNFYLQTLDGTLPSDVAQIVNHAKHGLKHGHLTSSVQILSPSNALGLPAGARVVVSSWSSLILTLSMGGAIGGRCSTTARHPITAKRPGGTVSVMPRESPPR